MLLYECVIRGGAVLLSDADHQAVNSVLPEGFRSLQASVADLARHTGDQKRIIDARRRVAEIIDIQEQIGAQMLDYLDEMQADWLEELAELTWKEVGGW